MLPLVPRMLALVALHAGSPSSAPAEPPAGSPTAAAAVLDTAIARMGGERVLRAIERVRFEMLTQWQRIGFDDRPYGDQPSFELHSDVRDYTIPAWRNTRRFSPLPGARTVLDIVRDSVGARRMGGPEGSWTPLNVAYVDERRELFTFAPERALLAARAAADLRTLPDTVIAGTAHARVAATLDRLPTVLFLRRGDGFLAMARYRAAHPNDFGLVPWGEMEVELWYSRWRRHPNGVTYPLQWDVRRVGRPYKRMTVLEADFAIATTPDSFAVSDAMRERFLATSRRPMHDLQPDSARLVEGLGGRLASFNTPGMPTGAVKLGRRWLLLETGIAPLSTERAAKWLERASAGSSVAGALVTSPTPIHGGAAWLAGHRLPIHLAPGADGIVRTILRNHRTPSSGASVIGAGRWLRVDGDSIRVEPIDFPDASGSLVVYVPSLRWVYSAMALTPVETELVMARARARGWQVEWMGSGRGVAGTVKGKG